MIHFTSVRAAMRLGNRGVTAIEFAVIVPVFIAILVGIIEFGSIMYTRHVMFYAAREAARTYVTGVSPSTLATSDVASLLLTEGGAWGDFTVTSTATGLPNSSAYITVAIATPMNDALLVDVLPGAIFDGKTLSVSATMYLDSASPPNTSCGKKKGTCSSKKKSSKKKKTSS